MDTALSSGGDVTVKLGYSNDWGTPELTRSNAAVELFLFPRRPAHPDDIRRRMGMPICEVRLAVKGACQITIPRQLLISAQLGAGQTVHLSGLWKVSGHVWGYGNWGGRTGLSYREVRLTIPKGFK